MNITLQAGRPLVLFGPQGCGKSTAAREIAARHGAYVEAPAQALLSSFELGALLARKPAVIILDEAPAELLASAEAGRLLFCESIVMQRKMFREERVSTPHFILCSSETNSTRMDVCDRRFVFVYLPTGKLVQP